MESKKIDAAGRAYPEEGAKLGRGGGSYMAGSGELDTGYTSSADGGEKRAAGDRSDPHLRAIN